MFKEILIEFSKNDVKYLVIGAVALGLSGYPRASFDLDILPDLTIQNLEKIISVLKKLGYKPVIPVRWEELKDPQKRKMWYEKKNMKVFSAVHPQKPQNIVDLMIYHPIDFESCFKSKQTVKIGNFDIYLVSMKDLLKLKKLSMRAKDLQDIQVIEEIIKMQNNE